MSVNILKVAVIGTGNIGKTIAANLVKGNRTVIIGSRKFKDAESLASGLGTLAKAFGTLGAASLESEAHRSPEKAVLFYATDNPEIQETVEELIRESGFDPYHVGGVKQSIRIEVFGDLHEFGALGKPVSAHEIEGKI